MNRLAINGGTPIRTKPFPRYATIGEEEKREKLILNFAIVDFLSSAALGKLITLDKKVKAHSGKLKLCNIRPEIYEVFAITKLNKLFDIKTDEAEALAALA